MGTVGIGLDAFLNAFQSGDQLGPGPVTGDDLAGILTDIRFGFSIVRDTFTAADRASGAAVTAATDAGSQAEKIGQNVKDITHQVVDTIIPHSLAWLEGYIVSHWIDPIIRRLNQDETRIGILEGFRRSTDTWRYKYVDPHLEEWIVFRKWFYTWPVGILNTWHDWFAHPGKFGEWAAAPIAGPLIAYLAVKAHHDTRDKLAGVMVSAWQEEPALVFEQVTEWLVS